MTQAQILMLHLTAILLLCGCKESSLSSDAPLTPPIKVQITQPKYGAITRFITLPGEIKPYQQATLLAKVTGYLKTITVDKGDHVKAGDLIAEIEVPEMLADVQKYKAEAEVAGLDLKRLVESQKKLPDLVVPQTVDNARGKLDVAKANLERTQTMLSYARITAPFAGIITRRNVDPGAFIPAATSSSSGQNAAIVTLTDLSRVRVQVAIPELESSLVATNQPTNITVEGLPGRAFAGNVSRFSYALEEQSKTMLAEIELPNPQFELRPGMYATVKIGLERKADALLVPVDALLFEKAGASVFTIANNKAKKVPVKTGFNDGANAQILTDLKPDQSVILLRKKTLVDGQPVQVETQ